MTTAPIPDPSGRSRVEGDAAARAAELFERHGRMVYCVCRAMLRDVHEAEDATQQAFLSAHRALLSGARVRDSGAWLATIARNECRARIAAGMRTPLPLADADLAAIPAPTDETERRLQADALRNAFAELPERQREAVVLRDLYGLRYGEVATALGLSRPATEALLFRARRAMRVRLRPVVGAVLAVPLAVREELASAIPGFAASGGSGAAAVGAAGAAGGLLAKLTATPVGIKVATVAVAATTVGAVGSVESDRPARDESARTPLSRSIDFDSSDADGSGSHGSFSGVEQDEEDEDGSSGPGGDDGDDRSGSSAGASDENGDDWGDTADGDDAGGSSGSGSGGDDEPDDDGGGGSSGSGGSESSDDSSGSGSSGSGSSGSSGSSGPGDVSDDSSGSGSGGDSSGSGSDSGDSEKDDSSGSGSGGGSGGPGSGDDGDD